VFVVDDFLKWRGVAKNNLECAGFRNISYFETTGSALEAHPIFRPELCLIDINFDDLDLGNLEGLGLCYKLKETEKGIVVVVMSSREDGAELAMKNGGADYFIRKPQFVEDFDKFMEAYES